MRTSRVVVVSVRYNNTATRIQWNYLPPELRSAIEQRLGSEVVAAQSQDSGFTPGMASVLTCADGTKHFVKAASTKAQRMIADSYREEARKLRGLPADAPAPRLKWTIDADWVVLGIEYVAATLPRRPWRQSELTHCVEAIEALAQQMTPAPRGLDLAPFHEEYAHLPALWEAVITADPTRPHADEAATLAAGFAPVTSGTTLVHTDLRADNTLLTPDDRVLFCDWNWLTTGAPWLDLVMYLIVPSGDGIDVEKIVATSPLTRDVAPEHIDTLLALLAGYFLKSSNDPVPPTSPHLREAQARSAEATWGWLSARRRWPVNRDKRD